MLVVNNPASTSNQLNLLLGLSNSLLIKCADQPKTVAHQYLSFRFDLNGDAYNNLPKLVGNDLYRINFNINLVNETRAFAVRVD